MSLPDMSVSVLMPVHAGVDSNHLAAALDSVLGQTRAPEEIVIVEDGPLPHTHLQVLNRLEGTLPRVVRVRLAQNHGAGVANQAGLEASTGEWIAKADADDINLPDRLARQSETVARTGVDVCGSAMLEFVENRDNVVSIRSMPRRHEQIGTRLRWNNPINHPTAFYRREAALNAGGYPSWRNMQDYGLFARMYANGSTMVNLTEPLVLFRASSAVVTRRRSNTTRQLERVLQRELRELHIIGKCQMGLNLIWRTGFRMLPPRAVSAVSRRVLARPAPKAGACL